MILCKNGHQNPDGATTCAVCGIDITPMTVKPLPSPAPPLVTLSETSLRTAVDNEVASQIRIDNVGGVTDEFEITLLGEAAAFGSVEPSSLAIEPAASGVAQVTFRPPASASGALAFEARVTSQQLPAEPVSTLGLVEITAPEITAPSEVEEAPTEELEVPPPAPPRIQRKRPKWLIALVALGLLVAVLVGAVIAGAWSDDGIAGTVITRGARLNVRNVPNDDSDESIIGRLERGDSVRINCTARDNEGDDWYRITSPQTGYVFARNVLPSERPERCPE
jgi:hypothetical protein